MSCAPLVSVVVRRTFLDMQLEGASEQLTPARPRADTDTCVQYSAAQGLESRAECDSMDDSTGGATTAADDASMAGTDVSDRPSWVSEMAPESESQATGHDAGGAATALWVAPVALFPSVDPAMQAVPMLCQQGTVFMMMPIAPAAPLTEAARDVAQGAEPEPTTTLVLRRLPKDLSSIQLRRMLDSADLARLYDFLYVPMNFKSARSLGYALVNFTAPEHALAAQRCLHGSRIGRGALVAELSRKHRGRRSLVEQYQSSHVLTDAAVPDEHKPQLFRDGEAIPFPIVPVESVDEC